MKYLVIAIVLILFAAVIWISVERYKIRKAEEIAKMYESIFSSLDKDMLKVKMSILKRKELLQSKSPQTNDELENIDRLGNAEIDALVIKKTTNEEARHRIMSSILAHNILW
jgi:hypothetical protein